MGALAYGVNGHHDGVVPARFWEFQDEVYTDDVPAFFQDQEWLEFPGRWAALYLSAEAQVAVGNIHANVLRHIRPPVVSGDELQGFEATWVPSHFGVMAE